MAFLRGGEAITVVRVEGRRRRLWVVIVVGVFLVTVGLVLAMLVRGPEDPQTSGRRSAGADLPTAWNVLHQRRLDDGLDTQLALDAFATLIAPIPGGEAIPADTVDGPGTFSGTPAVRWMVAQWDDLNGEQREVFSRVVYGRPSGTGLGGADSDPVVVPAGQVRGQDRDPEAEEAFQPLVDRVADEFGALTIRSDGGDEQTVELALPDYTVVASTVPSPRDAMASAAVMSDQAAGWSCVVTFYPPATALLGADEREDIQLLGEVIAHELYHCHQYVATDDWLGGDVGELIDWAYGRPEWILEGQAAWFGAWFTERNNWAYQEVTSWWEEYLAWPTGPGRLYGLDYSAIGFYAEVYRDLDLSVGTPWVIFESLDRMLATPTEDDAFTVAIEQTSSSFLSRWPMTLFHDSRMGLEWVTAGPGRELDLDPPEIPDATSVLPGEGPVTFGIDRPADVERARIRFPIGVEVVQVELAGHGALQWNGRVFSDGDPFGEPVTEEFDVPSGGSEERWYCTWGICECDNDPGIESLENVASIVDYPSAWHASLALTGGPGEADVTFTAYTLEEYCSLERRVPPPGEEVGEEVTAACEWLGEVGAEVFGEQMDPPEFVEDPLEGEALTSMPGVAEGVSCRVDSRRTANGDLPALRLVVHVHDSEHGACDSESLLRYGGSPCAMGGRHESGRMFTAIWERRSYLYLFHSDRFEESYEQNGLAEREELVGLLQGLIDEMP